MATITHSLFVVLLLASAPAGLAALRPSLSTTCDGSLGAADALRTAPSYGSCGAALARCGPKECCDQYGQCRAGDSCGVTCQCLYSGKESTCRGGGLPFFNDSAALQPVDPGGLCGDTLARCPDGYCCSSDSFCTNDPSICTPGRCKTRSSHSGDCRPALTAHEGPTTHNLIFVINWGVRTVAGITRQVILINGQFPFPTIFTTEGDTLNVLVVNELEDPTSIHWHGMIQFHNVIMDGAAGVTQRAIQPGHSQRYTFITDLQGTYWWHSHFKAQYVDGLKGGLVVRSRVAGPADPRLNPPPLFLSDWYTQLSDVLIQKYLNGTSNPDGEEAAIMNGVGQGECTGQQCQYPVVQGVAGSNCSNPQGNLKLTFINGAGFATFVVTVDEHLLVVDQLDAVTVGSSSAVPSIAIAPGQRVVVSLCRDYDPDEEDPTQRSFFINATMIQEVFAEDSTYPTVLGVLTSDPKETGPSLRTWPSSTPHGITGDDIAELLKGVTQDFYNITTLSKDLPPAATRNITLEILPYQDPSSDSPNVFHFNNISMVLSESGPSLLEQALSHSLEADADFGPHVVQVNTGDIVQLIFNNGDGGSHPLHFHGHWMWVMRQGNADEGYYADQPLVERPILRDTVEVQANSSLVVRWVANNPGMWILHCHIDWHMSAGLAMVFSYGI